MRVLAFDLGLSLGWASLDSERPGLLSSCGQWQLPSAPRGERWRRLVKRLDEAVSVSVVDVDFIALERVRRHDGIFAAHVYGGALAIVEAWACGRGLPIEDVSVSEVKEAATGRGNARKDAVLAAARARWPRFGFSTPDVADACFVGVAALRKRERRS